MASTDFSALTDGVDAASFARGVTQGVTPPPGGGSRVYAFNSIVGGVEGAAGLKHTAVNFDPMANGGIVSMALKRLPSGGPSGFAPLIYMSLQGNSVNDEGYLLGLQDGDPSFIALRKGTIASGLPDSAVGSAGVLRRSTDSFTTDTWLHLRLTVEVTGTGDVLLTVEHNDLDANDVAGPVWEAIPGMDQFVDDVAQINSGSAPFVGGRAGFAFWGDDITRRAAYDHFEVARQQ